MYKNILHLVASMVATVFFASVCSAEQSSVQLMKHFGQVITTADRNCILTMQINSTRTQFRGEQIIGRMNTGIQLCSENAVGSLVVATKNGSLDLDCDSLEVITLPQYGVLDNQLTYTSSVLFDDSFVISAMSSDGKTDFEITIFVSPSTSRYSAVYVGSTHDFPVMTDVELTDIAGIIDGDLTSEAAGWKFPAIMRTSEILTLGSNSDLSESIWVFQGGLDQQKANTILERFESLHEFFRWRTSYLILDNSDLDDGFPFVGFADRQYCGTRSPSSLVQRWRWREVLTGATVGAVVGGAIGSVIPVAGTAAGAIIGGAIAGAVLGGGGAYIVDIGEDPDNLEDNYLNSVVMGILGGVCGGPAGGAIGGGGIAGGGGGAAGGGMASPYAKNWRVLRY